MTAYNPARIAELVAEARESWKIGHHMRQRRVIELADQLDAAVAEIAVLRGVIDSGNEAFRVARDQWAAERDTLRAENDRLRSGLTAIKAKALSHDVWEAWALAGDIDQLLNPA